MHVQEWLKKRESIMEAKMEDDYEITLLADSFEDFIRGLVNEEVYESDLEEEKE